MRTHEGSNSLRVNAQLYVVSHCAWQSSALDTCSNKHKHNRHRLCSESRLFCRRTLERGTRSGWRRMPTASAGRTWTGTHGSTNTSWTSAACMSRTPTTSAPSTRSCSRCGALNCHGGFDGMLLLNSTCSCTCHASRCHVAASSRTPAPECYYICVSVIAVLESLYCLQSLHCLHETTFLYVCRCKHAARHPTKSCRSYRRGCSLTRRGCHSCRRAPRHPAAASNDQAAAPGHVRRSAGTDGAARCASRPCLAATTCIITYNSQRGFVLQLLLCACRAVGAAVSAQQLLSAGCHNAQAALSIARSLCIPWCKLSKGCRCLRIVQLISHQISQLANRCGFWHAPRSSHGQASDCDSGVELFRTQHCSRSGEERLRSAGEGVG